MSLERFKTAQEKEPAGYKAAVREILSGCKTSHWIWYIFPQLAGLGRSAPARFYALKSLDEACDFLRDPMLRTRLESSADAVAQSLARGIPLRDLMGGSLDAVKLVSSLTLFERAARRLEELDFDAENTGLRESFENILRIAADQGFGRCNYTIRACPNG